MTPATCPRCGAELVSLAGLALVLEEDARRFVEAVQALDRMRLALPSAVPLALRGAAGRWPHLARALACHAGTCSPTPKEP